MLKRLKKKILILTSMLLVVGMLSAGEVHATTYTNDYDLRTAAANQSGGQQMLTSGSRNVYLNLVCPSGTGTVTNKYNITYSWATAPTSSAFSARSGSKWQLNLGISKTSGTGPQSAALGASYAVTDQAAKFYNAGTSTAYTMLSTPLKITIPAGMHYASDKVTRGAVKNASGGLAAGLWQPSMSSTHNSTTAPTYPSATNMINNTTAAKTVNMWWFTHLASIGVVTHYDSATSKHCWLYTSSRRADHTITFARNEYTVKYNGNGSTGGSTAGSSHKYGLGSTLTENGFTKSGYAFTGWNTKADGSGTNYTDKQSVNNLTAVHGGEIELFAQWEPCDYTITYSGLRNDDTVGTLPTHADFDQTITIPNPKRTGSVFRGWNITGMDGCTHFYGRDKTTTTELSNIKATTFKNLRETDGAVNFEAVWIETTGEAYAVLDSAGKFTFFRSENNYDNNTTGTFTDIDGNSYSGRVFSDFESLSASGENNVRWLDYQGDIRTVTMAQSVFPVDMSWWFYDCPNAVDIDLSKIVPNDTKKVIGTFQGCGNLKKLNIKTLTSPQLTSMDGMICGLDSLKRICLGNNFRFTRTARDEMAIEKIQVAYAEFDSDTGILRIFRDDRGKYTNEQTDGTKTYYAGIEDITGTTNPKWYANRKSITKVVIESTFKPKTAYNMFSNCQSLTEIQGIENFDTSNVTNMISMFGYCSSLTSLDVSHFDTSNVTSMEVVFSECNNLTSIDVSHFDTSNVTSMVGLFSGCQSLTSLDISRFDTSNVTNMFAMFNGCENLTSLDLSHFDTSNVTDMSHMFSRCYSLVGLDLSHFDTSNVREASMQFNEAQKISTTLNIMNVPSSYSSMCYNAAQNSGQLTLKYISPVTSADIDTLVATKSNGNVVNGGQGTFVPPDTSGVYNSNNPSPAKKN